MAWIQDSAKECCSRCRFKNDRNWMLFWPKLTLAHWCILHLIATNCSDFDYDSSCNERHLMTVKFFAATDHCGAKALSEFRVGEDRFDSLEECCRAKFTQSLSHCCEKMDGHRGCTLSGSLKYIPVSSATWWRFRNCSLSASLNKMLTTLNYLSHCRAGSSKFAMQRIWTWWLIGSGTFRRIVWENVVIITCILMWCLVVQILMEVAEFSFVCWWYILFVWCEFDNTLSIGLNQQTFPTY